MVAYIDTDPVGNQNGFSFQVIDTDRETISFEALNIGEKVLVQGLKLIDGRVLVARVQQQ